MTEKDYNPEQRNAKAMGSEKSFQASSLKNQERKKQETRKLANAPIKKEEKKGKKEIEDKKVEEKKKPKKKIKKEEAVVRGLSLPISTKDSVAICRFIKNKPIEKAIADLEDALKFKKAIPMKGEIPHKKGKGMMSGRYPLNAIGHFVKMLKTLQANSNVNGIEEPVIVGAVPNKASRPYGRFGSVKRKRTHVKIKVKEKKK